MKTTENTVAGSVQARKNIASRKTELAAKFLSIQAFIANRSIENRDAAFSHSWSVLAKG